MNCNKCGIAFQNNEQMAITACQHVYCISCIKQIVNNGESCHICDKVIIKSTVKLVLYHRNIEDSSHMLCGQSTDFIIQSCVSAFHLALEQSKIELSRGYQQELNQNQQNYAKFEEAVKHKLTEIHGAYKRYKKKCSELSEEQSNMLQDRNELQDKYAQKTAQARRLQEICEKLQDENQKLKKMKRAPFFEARQQPSEDSHKHVHRQSLVATSSMKRHMQHSPYRQKTIQKTRASSDVSSFHAPLQTNVPRSFRASKHRIFEVTKAHNQSWNPQYHYGNKGVLHDENAIPNMDPFDITIRRSDVLQ